MGSVGVMDFNPNSIDMVFAVSQQNLNEGLAEYIQGLNARISWGFDVDGAGNLSVAKDPAAPDISFTGTLAPPPAPAPGTSPIWILDLSQSGAANQVTFNLTFQDGATFVDNQFNKRFVQSSSSGGPAWVVSFQVNLAVAAIANHQNVPEWLREQIGILNGNYGNVFDLTQILLDMQTLALGSDPQGTRPDGFLYYDWTLLLQGMSLFLASNSGNVFVQPASVGYVVTHNGAAPKRPLPTYTPTAAEFVIVPNPAAHGAASALVFALMIQDNPLPAAPANEFSNTLLIADPATTPGIALIRADHFLKFIQDDFTASALASAISHYVESVKSDTEGVSWQLAASSQAAVATARNPSSANAQQILSFAMPEKHSSAANIGLSTYSANSKTNSTASINYDDYRDSQGYRTIKISGTLSMSVGYSFTPPPHGGQPGIPTAWNSPTFDWNWSVTYQIQSVNASDDRSGGGVQFVLNSSASNFPEKPVNMGGGDKSWFSVSPSEQDFVTRLLAAVIKALPDAFKKDITSLGALGSFVFPGGGTFTFQSPAINNPYALYTVIQYQNPN
jgi:hypothetical protein